MPVATAIERLAAALCFVLTIGQCAFVGLYGNSLRKKLYKRSVELRKPTSASKNSPNSTS